MQYGATREEWDHFDLILGLGVDLLPVVSNPTATISPDSKMRGLGKTPSVYNKAGKVVGLPGWTELKANGKEFKAWSVQPDYGICIQTRKVRGIDIDVADPAQAFAISQFIEHTLGYELPMRYRVDTGKCLLAIQIEGELPYRKIVVDGGVVELLSDGKQFVAIGTHPSGTRYQWAQGLPASIPNGGLIEFDKMWQAMADKFAGGVSSGASGGARKREAHIELPDPVADLIELAAHGVDRDGALIIDCPWKADHSTGSDGDGSTVWFRAGSNGYEKGHFKCLHGHCAGRSDADFFEAIGYVEDTSTDFAVIEAPKGEVVRPSFKRDKNGSIEATVDNLQKALQFFPMCQAYIGHDLFRDELMFHRGDEQWQGFSDEDFTELRIAFERQSFKPIGRDLIRDVVLVIARRNRFDSAQIWLNKLQWDGVPRVKSFLFTYFGVDANAYVDSVSEYIWSAMAGRVLSPGCKADMVPILVGAQGVGKSTGVSAMVPSMDLFTEVSFAEKDDDLARKMRGRLVAEIGELRGLHTKELEGIKAFITRTQDQWIPKYKEFGTTFQRRLIFMGTTNQTEFLADETGNRRWLPVLTHKVDVDAIKRDMLQLWAEGAVMFKKSGVAYRSAELLATDVHNTHVIQDPWLPEIDVWLDNPTHITDIVPKAKGWVSVSEILLGCLGFDQKSINKGVEMRVVKILSSLGYRKVRMCIDKKQRNVWSVDKTLPF
jgi:hypothetical protein